ncbi:ROK family protein [Aquisphaera insulae]|uniref:ROK family protein n=1 Tax=Aquisphaera insulae TaxID=2712864 RepID=UPI0013E9FEDC|nr:ROK family protein [Aquisphaera insulae]
MGRKSAEVDAGGIWFPTGRRVTKPLYNRQLVCASLYRDGASSRVALHQATGIPLSRLSGLCGELIREGLVREGVVAPAEGNGRGRPQTLLEIDLRSLAVASVRHDQRSIEAAVGDLAGDVRWRRRWDNSFRDPDDRLRRLTAAARQAVAAAGAAGLRVAAVGAADPGTVDVAAGRSVRAVALPGWNNVPVVEGLARATGLRVFIDREDGWQALGEVTFGAGRGVRNAVFATLLEGIGGGIVESGRLLAGRDGSAGELGHTRVSDDGPLCGCGGRGCLEAHLAPSRLTALWRGESPGAPPRDVDRRFTEMIVAARGGDPKARSVLAEAADRLARGLGNVVSLLNPERIILGGRFVEAGEAILDPLRDRLPSYALPELVRGVDVRLAELGESSTALGMASYVREKLFAVPSAADRPTGDDEERPARHGGTPQ